MNIIARLEYELAYNDSAAHRFNHYTTRTPLKVKVLIFLFAFFYFHSVVCRDGKVHYLTDSLFFCLLSLSLVVWLRFGDVFVSQNPREVYASHSPGQILGCAYINCSYDQILIFCPTPNRILPHPVGSSLILFLHLFTAFTYYMIDSLIDSFVSITT